MLSFESNSIFKYKVSFSTMLYEGKYSEKFCIKGSMNAINSLSLSDFSARLYSYVSKYSLSGIALIFKYLLSET